jgi:hypothetical protein
MNSVEEVPNPLGRALPTAREREERGFTRLGFEWVLSPLIYRMKPETWICPSHEPDMSGENCLGSSENFRN